jgi:hypothetical protein
MPPGSSAIGSLVTTLFSASGTVGFVPTGAEAVEFAEEYGEDRDDAGDYAEYFCGMDGVEEGTAVRWGVWVMVAGTGRGRGRAAGVRRVTGVAFEWGHGRHWVVVEMGCHYRKEFGTLVE